MQPQTLQEKLAAIAKLTQSMSRKAVKANPNAPPVAFLAAGHEGLLDLGQLPTGNLPVDQVLAGGFSRGSIAMLAGEEGSGKSMLCFDMIAHNQKIDPNFMAIYVNLESPSFPVRAALRAGVEMSRLLVIPAQQNGERAFDLLLAYLWDPETRSPRDIIDLAVVDSIAAAVPADEVGTALKEGLEKQTVAMQARMMSKLLRVICGTGSLGKTCLVFVNQLRVNVGAYGSPEVTPGGRASAYASKIILKLRHPRSRLLKRGSGEDQEVYGQTVIVDVQKNNTGIGKPHQQTEYEVDYEIGVDLINPLVDAAIARGLIEETSKGRFQRVVAGELVKYHGKENLVAAVRQDETLRQQLERGLQGEIELRTELEAPVVDPVLLAADGLDLNDVVKAEAELTDWLSIRQEAAKSEM